MLLLRKTTGYLGVLPTRYRGHATLVTSARHPWRGAVSFDRQSEPDQGLFEWVIG